MNATYKNIFGPVPSRRFGRSLGVDLTPHKTCSLDCIFCQLGRTTEKTIIRKEYVPIDGVIAEIEDWFEINGHADYITLSGSGEPTLHSGFGEVLEFLNQYTIPSALLTNATMLYLPEVRNSASNANVVKASLSVWHQRSFEWVNRPHPELKFDQMVKGLKAFRSQFKGELWLEVFLLSGINSMPSDVNKISAIAKQIKPDRIHLNSVFRPPAEDFATAPAKNSMEELTHLFDPPAEIIEECKMDSPKYVDGKVNHDTILSLLRRRPCTMNQIAEVFGLHINEVSKYLGKLRRSNHIRAYSKNNAVYYQAVIKEDKHNFHV